MSDRYIKAAQQRVLQTILALAGNEFRGLTNAEVALAVGTSHGNALADVRNLEHAGLAERVPTDPTRWRLGPKLPQIALALLHARDRAQARVDEITQRYTREPT